MAKQVLLATIISVVYGSLSVCDDERKSERSVESVNLKESGELQWNKYSPNEFEKVRYRKPIIVALMRDLCPGCKAKRDALWADKKLKAALMRRNIVLFSGNAATDKQLAEQIKETFGVGDLPAVIVCSKPMSDKPIVLRGIPEPEIVIDALENKIPVCAKKSKL